MTPPTPTHETYTELQLVFDTFNQRLFDGVLPPCLLTLQREKRTFGYFVGPAKLRQPASMLAFLREAGAPIPSRTVIRGVDF